MADDAVKKKNPLKIWLIIIVVLLVIIVALLLTKNKVVLEDESGNTFTGATGKFLKSPESDEE